VVADGMNEKVLVANMLYLQKVLNCGMLKFLMELSMRKSYPSDISKEQFELILPDLKSARKSK
jgi:hypothetical protein